MKKTTFALAVAAALSLTAAQAETVLYGSLRIGVDYTSGYGYNAGSDSDEYMDVVDTGSRFGLKGGEELGNGVGVVFQAEWGFNAAEGGSEGSGFENRLAYIGLTGDFGTFAIGRQDLPFYNTIYGDATDVFNEVGTSATAVAAVYGLSGGSAGITSSSITTADISELASRSGNMIAYVSNNYSGFSFTAGLVADSGGNSKTADAWQVTAKYENSGFRAGAGYMEAKDLGNSWGVNGGYSNDMFNVGVAYAQGDVDNSSADSDGWDVMGEYYFGDSTVRARYGQAHVDNGAFGEGDLDSWSVGFEHKLSKRTRTWVEYARNDVTFDNNTQVNNTIFDENADRVNIGIRHDF